MEQHILRLSTADVDPREAKAYWSDHVANICCGLRVDFPNDDVFSASIASVGLGPAEIVDFRMDAHDVERTKAHIARDSKDCFALTLVRSGLNEISDTQSSVLLRSGDVGLGSTGLPFRMRMDRPITLTCLYLPSDWLRSFVAVPEDLLFRNLPSGTGWGRALTAALEALTPDTVRHLALLPDAIADQIASLLSLAAGPAAEDFLRTGRRQLLHRLRRELRDRLYDTTLDPGRFALDHGISVRTLHGLFAAANTSFMADLTKMRLDRAASLLRDRRFDTQTVNEIALRVGFANATHFGARFRKAFGLAPNSYRKAMREPR